MRYKAVSENADGIAISKPCKLRQDPPDELYRIRSENATSPIQLRPDSRQAICQIVQYHNTAYAQDFVKVSIDLWSRRKLEREGLSAATRSLVISTKTASELIGWRASRIGTVVIMVPARQESVHV